jgi:pSer/pThr/pTyr-binding forkhead associated (FHA) protein
VSFGARTVTFKLLDLESYNGTFINGIPVKEQNLVHADQLRVGKIELLFLIEEGDESNFRSFDSLGRLKPFDGIGKATPSGSPAE